MQVVPGLVCRVRGVVADGCYQVDGSVDRPAQVGGEEKSAHGQVIANRQYDVFQAGQGGLVIYRKYGAACPVYDAVDIGFGRMPE